MSSDSVLCSITASDIKMPTFSDKAMCFFFLKSFVAVHAFIPAACPSQFRDALILMILSIPRQLVWLVMEERREAGDMEQLDFLWLG